MAKKRTMNELRQTKEYKIDPVQQVLAQQIEELAERDHQENLDKAAAEGSTKYWPKENKEKQMNPSKYTENDLEQAKDSIVEKIVKHLDNVLFEMVCEEMGDNYLFQSSNYLTEAGFDMFEDEWFEFYHEQHGDILYQLRQTVFE